MHVFPGIFFSDRSQGRVSVLLIKSKAGSLNLIFFLKPVTFSPTELLIIFPTFPNEVLHNKQTIGVRLPRDSFKRNRKEAALPIVIVMHCPPIVDSGLHFVCLFQGSGFFQTPGVFIDSPGRMWFWVIPKF